MLVGATQILTLTLQPCGHVFHRLCLEKTRAYQKGPASSQCPLCRSHTTTVVPVPRIFRKGMAFPDAAIRFTLPSEHIWNVPVAQLSVSRKELVPLVADDARWDDMIPEATPLYLCTQNIHAVFVRKTAKQVVIRYMTDNAEHCVARSSVVGFVATWGEPTEPTASTST